jgi:hypothetical protein
MWPDVEFTNGYPYVLDPVISAADEDQRPVWPFSSGAPE